MSEDTMLVRMPSGDVVRRPVAHSDYGDLVDGRRVLLQENPELEPDEMVIRVFGDPIPRVYKTIQS